MIGIIGSARPVCAGEGGTFSPHTAPDFIRTGLKNTRVHLVDYRGKVVLLDFWATWCSSCLVEAPHFIQWQNQYGQRGFQILGISMDDEQDVVLKQDRKLHWNYPVLMGDAQLGKLYGGILGLPVLFLIDRDGIVRARFEGENNLAKVEAMMKELLAERKTADRQGK